MLLATIMSELSKYCLGAVSPINEYQNAPAVILRDMRKIEVQLA